MERPNRMAYSSRRALFGWDDAYEVDGASRVGWIVQGWIECPSCPNGLAYSLKRALFCLDDASEVDGASKVGWID